MWMWNEVRGRKTQKDKKGWNEEEKADKKNQKIIE
jgi:hypothetical protein